MIHGEPRMVEGRAQPTRSDPGGVAGHARRGEPGGGVVRIRRAQVGGLMTGIAIGRRAGEYAANVAQIAGDVYVRSLQRERCVVMIERSIQPGRRCVAHRAVLGVAGRDVIGDTWDGGGVVVILLMATETSRGQRSRIVVGMAGGAGHVHMRARQRKRRVVVIERGIQPGGSAVAQRAILREIGSHVVRNARDRSGIVVVLGMAAVAGRGCGRIVPARMALRAL